GQGLADADQREIGGLLEDVEEIAEAQETIRRNRAGNADGADKGEHAREAGIVAEPGRQLSASTDSGAHAARSLVASCMMLSSAISWPASSPVTRPSRMTMTRSAMPMTSVSSELIIRIATPEAARSRMMR